MPQSRDKKEGEMPLEKKRSLSRSLDRRTERLNEDIRNVRI